MEEEPLNNLQGVNIDSLPVGLTLKLRVPGYDELITFTTDQEGHNLRDTIYHFIRDQSDLHQGIFDKIDIDDINYRIFAEIKLSEIEFNKYLDSMDSSKMNTLLKVGFLSSVLYRLNFED